MKKFIFLSLLISLGSITIPSKIKPMENEQNIEIKKGIIRNLYELSLSPITKTIDGTKYFLEAIKQFTLFHPTKALENLWISGSNYYIAGLIFYTEMLIFTLLQGDTILWESSVKLADIILNHVINLIKDENFKKIFPIFLNALIKPIILLSKKITPDFIVKIGIKIKDFIPTILEKL